MHAVRYAFVIVPDPVIRCIATAFCRTQSSHLLAGISCRHISKTSPFHNVQSEESHDHNISDERGVIACLLMPQAHCFGFLL